MFNHASHERTIGTPESWCPCTKTRSMVYPHDRRRCHAAMRRSACGSMGSMDFDEHNQLMADRLSHASQKVGLADVGGQNVRVNRMPTIPATLLQKELWLSS